MTTSTSEPRRGGRRRAGAPLLLALALASASALVPTGAAPSAAATTPPLPASDPANAGGWVYSDHYSDEFDQAALDTAAWEKLPLTWRQAWRWDDGDAAVSDGSLNLTSEYAPDDSFNQTVQGWTSAPSGDSYSDQADYVTTQVHRTGGSALVQHNYYSFHIVDRQTFANLPAGTYNLAVQVKSTGTHTVSRLVVTCGGTTTTTPVPDTTTAWTQLKVPGVAVAAGADCTVGVESASDTGAELDVDDTWFGVTGTTANLLANPGFETRTSTPYRSGGVKSRDTVKYGYLEVGMKAGSADPGTCPAFWLYNVDQVWGNEIDIEEVGEAGPAVDQVDLSTHQWKYPGFTGQSNTAGSVTASSSVRSSFHTYGLEWGPGYLKWYVDGALARTYSNAQFDQSGLQVFLSQGMRPPYSDSSPPLTTGLPSTSRFSYLRVWKRARLPIPATDTVIGVNGTQTPGDGIGEDLFRYSGNWTSYIGPGGVVTQRSYHAGDSFRMTFYGTGAALKGILGPAQGRALVSVDGGAPTTIDDYAATPVIGELYTVSGLAAGRHTLTVTVTGQNDPAAQGPWISASGIDVLNG
ncbi:family 16 glycosylhydrolase [Kitasatospora sp. NA04385]|uniref:family 16 glycosylhydrolase n=1 Tax=Kitasatospora sp. NA04385 TaxID=2742135 RepID=UPI001591A04B|nr:family 16 glycosylhydrolase [Kitasatospora sp. NA04385]QKW17781.1 family 16 glycosylhydrolase [Kitasatospora sp. NA04385]